MNPALGACRPQTNFGQVRQACLRDLAIKALRLQGPLSVTGGIAALTHAIKRLQNLVGNRMQSNALELNFKNL